MNVERKEIETPNDCIRAELFRFRKKTLLKYNDTAVIVSTVGIMNFPMGESVLAEKFNVNPNMFKQIGHDRYYETMVFYADPNDDVDVTREIEFESEWSIDHLDADNEAIAMHENVIREISKRLSEGEFNDN